MICNLKTLERRSGAFEFSLWDEQMQARPLFFRESATAEKILRSWIVQETRSIPPSVQHQNHLLINLIRSMPPLWNHPSMYVHTHSRDRSWHLLTSTSAGTMTLRMKSCSEATQILYSTTRADSKPEVKMNSRRWRYSFWSAHLPWN